MAAPISSITPIIRNTLTLLTASAIIRRVASVSPLKMIIRNVISVLVLGAMFVLPTAAPAMALATDSGPNVPGVSTPGTGTGTGTGTPNPLGWGSPGDTPWLASGDYD